jgi:hypothetical protein
MQLPNDANKKENDTLGRRRRRHQSARFSPGEESRPPSTEAWAKEQRAGQHGFVVNHQTQHMPQGSRHLMPQQPRHADRRPARAEAVDPGPPPRLPSAKGMCQSSTPTYTTPPRPEVPQPGATAERSLQAGHHRRLTATPRKPATTAASPYRACPMHRPARSFLRPDTKNQQPPEPCRSAPQHPATAPARLLLRPVRPRSGPLGPRSARTARSTPPTMPHSATPAVVLPVQPPRPSTQPKKSGAAAPAPLLRRQLHTVQGAAPLQPKTPTRGGGVPAAAGYHAGFARRLHLTAARGGEEDCGGRWLHCVACVAPLGATRAPTGAVLILPFHTYTTHGNYSPLSPHPRRPALFRWANSSIFRQTSIIR